MLIPSPRNTVRIYLLLTRKEDLEDLAESRFEGVRSSSHAKTSRVTLLDVMNRRLPSILHPYTLSVKHVFWISKYIIAQRLTSSFSAHDHHLLLVGDSSHSHSPKAAQGMNTGIQDAYNLAWKLALVLRGRGDPKILLESYETERTHIARQLIDFDTKFAKLFANQDKIHSPEFHDLWKASQGFTSGLGHQYLPGPLVDPSLAGAKIDEDAIEPMQPGKRLLPMQLVRHIDGLELSSLDTMPANGDLNVVIFAGDISQEPRRSDFRALYHKFNVPDSLLSNYNGPLPTSVEQGQGWPPQETQHNSDHQAGSSKTIDLYIVHTANHLEVELRPDFEVWKYNFFEDKGGLEHERHGVDPEESMQVAVVRPDHVIAMVRRGDAQLIKDLVAFLASAGIQAVR